MWTVCRVVVNSTAHVDCLPLFTLSFCCCQLLSSITATFGRNHKTPFEILIACANGINNYAYCHGRAALAFVLSQKIENKRIVVLGLLFAVSPHVHCIKAIQGRSKCIDAIKIHWHDGHKTLQHVCEPRLQHCIGRRGKIYF